MEQGCIIGSGPSAPAGSVVQVCFPSVRAAVLDSLNRQREEGRLCDLSIQVQGQVFRAHRCVLAASSPYFHDQVLLKNVTTVSLPSVMDPVAFESVLSSAYTGQLSIVLDDIVNYVTVASFLQMWHIVDKCTEILKRPRPPVEGNLGEAAAIATHHGTSSRQQSPSSSDCLYMEREGKGKERRPYGQEQNALPPLATWRRPQQFPRWGRPRPPSQAPMSTSMSMPAQHLADSQLDSNPGGESDYSSCEEVWMSSNSKASPFGHDGRGQDHSHMIRQGGGGGGGGGGFPGETSRLRARLRQRGVPPTTEKLHGRDRGSGENGEGFGGELQEKRRNERGIEADEGMGEEVEEEKRARSERTGHSGDFHTSGHQGVQPERKVSSEELLKKEERKLGRGSDMTVEEEVVIPGPSCPGPTLSTRMPWQASPWSQQGARPHNGEDEDEEEEEEEVDFSRFADGAFGGDTYDEIEDGTGQVSQRPLVPASPVDSEFNLAAPELNWHSANLGQGGGGGGVPTPTSSRHLSPPSPAPLPPSSSSPPIPSSSSSLSLAGAPYTGKVHFCHCGKAYTLKSMRDRHVKMQHLNLRPFTCPVCAKSFKMKHHLTKHLKTHGGLRPYECGHCGKKVIWRDSFLRHQARCERLAVSYDGSAADRDSAAAADVEDGYGYGFDEGEGFLSEGGQVKVEQVEFHGEVEGGMSGLLSGVSGDTGNDLGTHSEPRTLVSHGFKEEASERFS